MTGIGCIMAGMGGSRPVVTASDVSGFNFGGAGLCTSNTPGTTVSGGTTPYTYLWSFVSGDARINVSSTTAQDPTFSATLGDTDSANGVWRVTVTDAQSRTSFFDINVSLSSA